jgi:hypothetical protein
MVFVGRHKIGLLFLLSLPKILCRRLGALARCPSAPMWKKGADRGITTRERWQN